MKKVELHYDGKAEESEVLEGARPAALREERVFGNGDARQNMLISGDNLPVLRILIDMGLRGEVKLVYIDPPFGTGNTYKRNGIDVYSSKGGTEYLEWLRRRIILLRHLLANDGSLYMRIDYHYGHYMKVLLDEIFGKENSRNELIVNRTKKIFDGTKRFNTATDSVFFYTKTEEYIFNGYKKERSEEKRKWIPMHSPGVRWTKIEDSDLNLFKNTEERGGRYYTRARIFKGKEYLPPPRRHWTFTQERLNRYAAEGRIRLNGEMLEYQTGPQEIVDSNWTDIPGYSFKWDYPTENSEQLLERIIKASSNPGDMVLDCFAGSGTTGAVAEKLDRKWIMIDSSGFSMQTITKRMLSLRESIGNKGKRMKTKPFSVYIAGDDAKDQN